VSNVKYSSAAELIKLLKSDYIPAKYHDNFDKSTSRFINESMKSIIDPKFHIKPFQLREGKIYTWFMGAEPLACTYMGFTTAHEFKLGNSTHKLSSSDVKEYIFDAAYMNESFATAQEHFDSLINDSKLTSDDVAYMYGHPGSDVDFDKLYAKQSARAKRQIDKHFLFKQYMNESITEVQKSSKPIPLSKIDINVAKQAVTMGLKDGAITDDTVTYKSASVAVKDLKAAQTEIIPDKAIQMALGMMLKQPVKIGGDLGSIISGDNYIMDGHHRWAATYLCDPNASVSGTKISLNGGLLVTALNLVTKGKFGRDGNHGSGNIKDFTSKVIKPILLEYAEKGIGGKFPINADDVKSRLCNVPGANGDYLKGIEIMSSNADKLPKQIMPGAPARVDMPVINPEDVFQTASDIAKGKVDLTKPYINENHIHTVKFDSFEAAETSANTKGVNFIDKKFDFIGPDDGPKSRYNSATLVNNTGKQLGVIKYNQETGLAIVDLIDTANKDSIFDVFVNESNDTVYVKMYHKNAYDFEQACDSSNIEYDIINTKNSYTQYQVYDTDIETLSAILSKARVIPETYNTEYINESANITVSKFDNSKYDYRLIVNDTTFVADFEKNKDGSILFKIDSGEKISKLILQTDGTITATLRLWDDATNKQIVDLLQKQPDYTSIINESAVAYQVPSSAYSNPWLTHKIKQAGWIRGFQFGNAFKDAVVNATIDGETKAVYVNESNEVQFGPAIPTFISESGKIENKEQFTEYVNTVLKAAHGEDFDKDKAKAVTDGLVDKYKDDYGAMVGALTSGFANESDDTEWQVISIMANKNYREVCQQFVSDCKGNGIKYEAITKTKFKVAKTPKAETAIKLVKERLGSNNVSVKDYTHNINESFMRIPNTSIGNELYSAQKALTNFYERVKSGNDYDQSEMQNIIAKLNKVDASAKSFDSLRNLTKDFINESWEMQRDFENSLLEIFIDAKKASAILSINCNGNFNYLMSTVNFAYSPANRTRFYFALFNGDCNYPKDKILITVENNNASSKHIEILNSKQLAADLMKLAKPDIEKYAR
jgi:hypothetical protein